MLHYREGETNHCPGCGRSQWLVGRLLAECAFCSAALPLATPVRCHVAPVLVVQRRDFSDLVAW